MPTALIMPKFEMSQEEGTIVRWLREEGEWVEKGDPVLEVETDKVVMEVEAPATGFLRDIKTSAGERVPVTTVIAVLYAAGEESAGEKLVPVEVDALTALEKQQSGERQLSGEEQRFPRETPLARRVAMAAGIDVRQVPPGGQGKRVTRQDVEKYLAGNGAPLVHEKPRATPAARRAAREMRLDLSAVAGHGPRGRVQEADVQAYIHQMEQATTQELIPTATVFEEERQPVPPAATAQADYEVIPLRGMRKTIADRLQQSYQTAPHITFTSEVDMSAVYRLRSGLNAKVEKTGGARISVTAVLVRVCAWALKRNPWLNSTLIGEDVYRYTSVNVGVAVALEEGLIVPVIHQADRLGLAEMAGKLDDLSNRARLGKLTPQEVVGGTFTISNLGMFPVDQFTAILNPPQAAILAVGRTVKRPVVVEDPGGDRVEIRLVMKITLSADHRIIDGAVAARFLQDLVAGLEDPNLLLL